MTRVSKVKLSENKLQEIREYFSYLISTFSDSSEIEIFLDGFLTKEEKIMLTKRLVLYMMIKKEYSPSIIQSALRISYETVRTYTMQLSGKNQKFYQTIEKLNQREKAKEFWEKVDKLLKPVNLALRAKTNMKARAKFASGDWE